MSCLTTAAFPLKDAAKRGVNQPSSGSFEGLVETGAPEKNCCKPLCPPPEYRLSQKAFIVLILSLLDLLYFNKKYASSGTQLYTCTICPLQLGAHGIFLGSHILNL